MKINESQLKHIITECIHQVLLETRGIQSSKLYMILKQHGGVESNPLFDLHNMRDDDIIDVVDRGTLYGFKTERDLRNYGLQKGFNLRPSDTVEYMELKDGMYLIGVLRAGAYDYTSDKNKDTSNGNFEQLTKKRDQRAANRDKGYQWQNKDAEFVYKNPFWRNKTGAWSDPNLRSRAVQLSKTQNLSKLHDKE